MLCYIRSAAYFFHFQSARSYNNNHATEASSLINKPKVRVYFRRIVYSGLFIGKNLLSEVTAVHSIQLSGLIVLMKLSALSIWTTVPCHVFAD